MTNMNVHGPYLGILTPHMSTYIRLVLGPVAAVRFGPIVKYDALVRLYRQVVGGLHEYQLLMKDTIDKVELNMGSLSTLLQTLVIHTY